VVTVMPGKLLESIRTAMGAGATTSDIDGRDSQALSRPDFPVEVEVEGDGGDTGALRIQMRQPAGIGSVN
jgi:hypothetical protein